MKIQKHLVFPKELFDRISTTNKVPKYLDFTTKIFMLLEIALADDGDGEVKKKDGINPISPILSEEKRARPRHRKAS